MGRVEKGQKCNVSGCGNESARSLSVDKVRAAGLKIGGAEKRAYLCKDHYKEYKKGSKKDKQLDKWRFG
jgi:hypothetical protein